MIDIIGKCALCTESKVLKKSYFFPKFIYRIISRIKDPNTEKVLLKNDRNANPLFFEIKKILLCGDCEGKLNSCGENHLARLLSPTDNFISKLLMIYAQNLVRRELSYTNELVDIDNDKLFYFATSIFWRATFDWYGYESVKFDQGIMKEMTDLLLYNINPKSYLILSFPLYLFEQYYMIFPKKYTRKDIFNGDFFYFTIFGSCFVLMKKDVVNRYINSNIKDSDKVYHIFSDVLQIGIMKEFLFYYKRKNKNSEGKYKVNLSWIEKYLYSNFDNIFGKYSLCDDIRNLIDIEGKYKYFYFLSKTGDIRYWRCYIRFESIRNISYKFTVVD
ncbi:hypothetical protein H0248_15860 [Pectobacterium brasiliense]|uniref:hypothetical protein n=1 Tax=Pectobacterium brasiliense TaxID=180957 RepID=UPI0015DEF497|nr:hypothetical protein [Pectobacterium brasiliense]MBA0218818.1 hypothetical protein [Pectobacterium brasiliense]